MPQQQKQAQVKGDFVGKIIEFTSCNAWTAATNLVLKTSADKNNNTKRLAREIVHFDLHKG